MRQISSSHKIYRKTNSWSSFAFGRSVFSIASWFNERPFWIDNEGEIREREEWGKNRGQWATIKRDRFRGIAVVSLSRAISSFYELINPALHAHFRAFLFYEFLSLRHEQGKSRKNNREAHASTGELHSSSTTSNVAYLAANTCLLSAGETNLFLFATKMTHLSREWLGFEEQWLMYGVLSSRRKSIIM